MFEKSPYYPKAPLRLAAR